MNSRRFVEAYNRIDEELRRLAQSDRRETFRRVLQAAAQCSPVVRTYEREIAKYGELRNAIVHEAVSPDFVIAEPHPDVVEQIEKIAALLLDPPKVGSVATLDVKWLEVNDPITRALHWSKTHSISLFPVYDKGRFVGLLGPKCIARWLAGAPVGDCIRVDEVRVYEVLAYDERGGRNVAFLGPDASVFDAIALFAQVPQSGHPRLEAILVTEHGRPNHRLLGIITPKDVLGMRNAV